MAQCPNCGATIIDDQCPLCGKTPRHDVPPYNDPDEDDDGPCDRPKR